MARLGWAILVGLLLAASAPGISSGENPETNPYRELAEAGRKQRQLEREFCAQYKRDFGGNDLHCQMFQSDHFFREGVNSPEWKSAGPRAIRWASLDARKRVRELVSKGANLNAKDLSGNTPIHIVANSSGDPELLAILLEGGANPNLYNVHKITPLMMASRRGDLATVEMLLHHGADETVNLRGELRYQNDIYRGFTALHWAALNGHPDIVTALLRAGADPYSPVHGHTALDLADVGRRGARGSVVRHYETIKIIRRAQAMITEQTRGKAQRRAPPRRQGYRQAY